MRRNTRVRRSLVIVLLALGAPACSAEVDPAPPEQTTLRIGVSNPVDTAPLRLAVVRGDFARAGLQVELVDQPGAEQALAALAAGRLDLTAADDVSLLRSAGGGTALRVQGEAYVAGRLSMALVTRADSDYREPGARRAPRIAVDSPTGLGTLTVRSALGSAGVDPARIRFVPMPFDRMAPALLDDQVDAAWMVEPYLTEAQKDLGVRVLADTATGATQNFPMTGYVATAAYATAHAEPLGRFRDLLARAQQLATDPTTVRDGLAEVAGLDRTSAALLALGSYPVAPNAVRLQRVADLMQADGALPRRLDVRALLP